MGKKMDKDIITATSYFSLYKNCESFTKRWVCSRDSQAWNARSGLLEWSQVHPRKRKPMTVVA